MFHEAVKQISQHLAWIENLERYDDILLSQCWNEMIYIEPIYGKKAHDVLRSSLSLDDAIILHVAALRNSDPPSAAGYAWILFPCVAMAQHFYQTYEQHAQWRLFPYEMWKERIVLYRALLSKPGNETEKQSQRSHIHFEDLDE